MAADHRKGIGGPGRSVALIAKPISLGLRLFGNLYAGELIFILIAIVFTAGAGLFGAGLSSLFGDHIPARSAIICDLVFDTALIEIDVIAKQGDKETCCLFGLQTTMQLTARPDGPPPG